MGILIIGLAIGGVASLAAIIHLIGHSLIKASFFLTSGNVLKIYSTKKIKSVTGLLNIDEKNGWLWILSLIGILALPPSILFISEFMIIRSLLQQHKILLTVIFFLLLTIIMYGLAKAVIKMVFAPCSTENIEELNANVRKIDWTMVLPQYVMLIITFTLGIYFPLQLSKVLQLSVLGF